MYYDPAQLQMMMAYAGNPMVLQMLRQAYSRVQAPDQGSIDQQAIAKKNEYMNGQVAPALARLMVNDGPTASSFAAARQAALAQAGQAQADNVYADAKANASDLAYRKYSMDKQAEEDGWNQFAGGLYGQGYGGSDQGMRMGGTSGIGAQSTRQPSFSDRAMEAGSGVLNYVGKKATTDLASGTNPFARYGNAAGTAIGMIQNAPNAIGSAFKQARNALGSGT